jgi:hypothetical protein
VGKGEVEICVEEVGLPCFKCMEFVCKEEKCLGGAQHRIEEQKWEGDWVEKQ